MTSTMNMPAFMGGLILSMIWIFNIYIFFESTEPTGRLLSAGAFVLLLTLLIPFWIQVVKALGGKKR